MAKRNERDEELGGSDQDHGSESASGEEVYSSELYLPWPLCSVTSFESLSQLVPELPTDAPNMFLLFVQLAHSVETDFTRYSTMYWSPEGYSLPDDFIPGTPVQELIVWKGSEREFGVSIGEYQWYRDYAAKGYTACVEVSEDQSLLIPDAGLALDDTTVLSITFMVKIPSDGLNDLALDLMAEVFEILRGSANLSAALVAPIAIATLAIAKSGKSISPLIEVLQRRGEELASAVTEALGDAKVEWSDFEVSLLGYLLAISSTGLSETRLWRIARKAILAARNPKTRDQIVSNLKIHLPLAKEALDGIRLDSGAKPIRLKTLTAIGEDDEILLNSRPITHGQLDKFIEAVRRGDAIFPVRPPGATLAQKKKVNFREIFESRTDAQLNIMVLASEAAQEVYDFTGVEFSPRGKQATSGARQEPVQGPPVKRPRFNSRVV